MAIVYYTNPNTKVKYAYESTPRWDPEHHQPRPVKRYLGRVDPVSGEIIPTSGRRGRRKLSEDPMNEPNVINRDYKFRYEAVQVEADSLRSELNTAKNRITQLEKQLKQADGILTQFAARLQTVLHID